MSQLLPPKKEVALALLERSNVDVYLDPRAKGVVVPPQFRKEPRLILKIGLNMPVPIPDLRLDDESMSCTLSFSRSPFFCVVPWDSVFAMVGDDGRGMVWPDDVPQELAVRVVEERRTPTDRESAPAPSSKSGRGRGKGAADEAARAEGADDAERPARAKRPRKKPEAAPKLPRKEEARPALVAVPPREDRPAVLQDRREERREERRDDRRDAPSRAPAPRPQAPPPSQSPGSRPKRELPPYLRVVK